MKQQLKSYSSINLIIYIQKSILVILFVLAPTILFSQFKYDRYKGVVLNKSTGTRIDSVKIQTFDSVFIFYTNKRGIYSFKLPRDYDSTVAVKKGYDKSIIKPSSRPIRIFLNPNNSSELEYEVLKNSLEIYPLKIPIGSFMIAYERSLSQKNSLLLMTRYYYNGLNFFGSESFTGYEISSAFRRYFSRNPGVCYYLQAKAIFAHFDFSRLNYQYMSKYTKSVNDDFNTWGGAFSIGFTNTFGGSRHFIFDMSFSAKLLLHNYPSEITDEHGIKYVHNPAWWYLGGPGSLIEFNLGIGGLW